MTNCDICGKSDALIHTCNHCSKRVCPEHLQPENHNCPSLFIDRIINDWYPGPSTLGRVPSPQDECDSGTQVSNGRSERDRGETTVQRSSPAAQSRTGESQQQSDRLLQQTKREFSRFVYRVWRIITGGIRLGGAALTIIAGIWMIQRFVTELWATDLPSATVAAVSQPGPTIAMLVGAVFVLATKEE